MKQLFSTLPQAIQSLQKGKMIILVDDQHRENEGDFVLAAQFASEKTINFMITHGKGLVCAPVSAEVANRLDLTFMASSNTESFGTAFTVSIDAKTNTTGISAKERADTLNLLANPKAKPQDFVRPGHMFPLIGKRGGVKERPGHTEASLTLMHLAGLHPIAVICEIILPNGKMARRPDLFKIAKTFKMPILDISQLMKP